MGLIDWMDRQEEEEELIGLVWRRKGGRSNEDGEGEREKDMGERDM